MAIKLEEEKVKALMTRIIHKELQAFLCSRYYVTLLKADFFFTCHVILLRSCRGLMNILNVAQASCRYAMSCE